MRKREQEHGQTHGFWTGHKGLHTAPTIHAVAILVKVCCAGFQVCQDDLQNTHTITRQTGWGPRPYLVNETRRDEKRLRCHIGRGVAHVSCCVRCCGTVHSDATLQRWFQTEHHLVDKQVHAAQTARKATVGGYLRTVHRVVCDPHDRHFVKVGGEREVPLLWGGIAFQQWHSNACDRYVFVIGCTHVAAKKCVQRGDRHRTNSQLPEHVVTPEVHQPTEHDIRVVYHNTIQVIIDTIDGSTGHCDIVAQLGFDARPVLRFNGFQKMHR